MGEPSSFKPLDMMNWMEKAEYYNEKFESYYILINPDDSRYFDQFLWHYKLNFRRFDKLL